MFNYNTYYRNNPYSMYNYKNTYNAYSNFNNFSKYNQNNYNTTSTTEFNSNIKNSSNLNSNSNDNISNIKEELKDNINPNANTKNQDNTRTEKESGFRFGPLTVYNDQIDILGFSFAIDDLIIIGLMLIIFLDSDSDFVLLIILGLILFNVSFSNLNLF